MVSPWRTRMARLDSCWLAQELGALGTRGGVSAESVGEPRRVGETEHRVHRVDDARPITVQAGSSSADAGFGACAIEATSIGIDEHRWRGEGRCRAVPQLQRTSRLSPGTMEAYWEGRRAVRVAGLKAAGLNVDDARGASLASS